MKEITRPLLHFPVLSRADFVFFRLRGSGLGNLLFPLYRAYQARQLQGGLLVFPQFLQLKPGPLMRREPDARAYGDIFQARTAKEVMHHARALWLLHTGKDERQLRIYEGLGRHFHELSPALRADFRRSLIQRYRQSQRLQQALSKIHEEDIAVHIRRGDFAASTNPMAAQGTMNFIIEDEWYVLATELARQRSPSGKVRVFTDSSELPPSLLKALKPNEIDQSPDALHSLMKMSGHGTIVTSRSSFSLWAAYLGNSHAFVNRDFDIERYMPIETLDISRC
jgi:hypothetical protein